MTLLDKQEILAAISEGDPWFLESGAAFVALEGLYVWEESTSVTISFEWLDEEKSIIRFSWVSTNTDARFWVYVDGVQRLANSQATFTDVSVQAGQGVVIEAFDTVNHKAQAGFPVRFTLGWFHVAGTAQYKVEEFVSAVWTERALITDTGEGFFTFNSGPLADDTVHQFRITPIGTNGNSGTILTFSTLMVRVPDPTDVTMVYNGSGTPTVTITDN